jgi:hypothetical protein
LLTGQCESGIRHAREISEKKIEIDIQSMALVLVGAR